MERLRLISRKLLGNFACLTLTVVSYTLVGCGNGGSINFQDPATTPVIINERGADLSFAPASLALSIEPARTTANGYHAKLQFNPNKGTELSGSGYKLKLKHTTRNR